jgi:DtxR family Mn-dependent transcriptional regulator
MATDSQRCSPRSQWDCADVGRTGVRYLFAIATLSAGGDERVSTGRLREYLDVAAASVTGMVEKLDERGLVDHEKYRGVRLTSAGESAVERHAWQVCVVSSFFESEFGTVLDERTAFEVAYALPEDGVLGLRDLAESPCRGLCPGGVGDAEECAA